MNAIQALMGEIALLMSREDRQDVEFRLAIALSQFGDVAKYVTHDPKLNPNARPHGTRADEIHAFGQLLVQILAIAVLREIDVFAALEIALSNWRERDWKAVKPKENPVVVGRTAHQGNLVGKAHVDPDLSRLDELRGKILITNFVRAEHVMAVKGKALAIVTDQGGVTSHPAIIAREYNIPCIVGTGDATSRICDGQLIEFEATGEEGTVRILEN